MVKEEQNTQIKRLYRSKEDRMIAGVSGGIAEYLQVDPVWIRLITVILLFWDGIGLLIYIILWILVPENPYQTRKAKKDKKVEHKVDKEEKALTKKEINDSGNGRFIVGGFLILLGVIFLFKQYFDWINFGNLWPLILIAFGLILLIRR